MQNHLVKKSWIEYCWAYQELIDSRVIETDNNVLWKRLCMHSDGKYTNKSLRNNEETDLIEKNRTVLDDVGVKWYNLGPLR